MPWAMSLRLASLLSATVRSANVVPKTLLSVIVLAAVMSACGGSDTTDGQTRSLDVAVYEDKLHGSWQATMFANFSGLDLQGVWLEEPGAGDSIPLLTPDQWSTDDDTHIEWVDLHILETHGLDPSYEDIRDEWVDHLNNDIWVSNLRARELMEQGLVPPETGNAENNKVGSWSIGAQLQTELFGMIAPGLPDEARDRAAYFAAVTNSGPAVEASQFYAHMYSEAFFESDVDWLIDRAIRSEPADSEIGAIARQVRSWHQENPTDWRATRRNIHYEYDTDPDWWASRVNFAATIMALLYGDGDLEQTMTIAGLAGWDADNNMTTSSGLLGVIIGFDDLPDLFRNSTDIYFNQDVTGDLPEFDSVSNIAKRTAAIGNDVIAETGGKREGDTYYLPLS